MRVMLSQGTKVSRTCFFKKIRRRTSPHTPSIDVQGRVEADARDQDRDRAQAGCTYRHEESVSATVSTERQKGFAEPGMPGERCCTPYAVKPSMATTVVNTAVLPVGMLIPALWVGS